MYANHGRARPLAGAALATVATAAAVFGAITPAHAAGTARAASSLWCNTGTGGSFGSYYGWGSCTGTGYWKLRVSCTAGFTYDSPTVLNFEDTQLMRYGSCTWGVSSVQVIPLS